METRRLYWFKSDQFNIQDGEEELTNPGRFGKSLAEWISSELSILEYETEVIPEDWGWCVMCSRNEYLLWVGCGNVLTEEVLNSTQDNPPDEKEIIWHVYTCIEIPFYRLKSKLKKIFGFLDTTAPKRKLDQEVKGILIANKTLSFCEEPA